MVHQIYRQNHHSTYKSGACSGWLQLQNTLVELFGEHDFIPSVREGRIGNDS